MSGNCPCQLDINGKCPCDPNDIVISNGKNNLANALSFAGNTLYGVAQTGTPNPFMGAIGSGLAGLASGGPLGALLGVTSGYLSTGMARSDYENTLADEQNRYMLDRTFMPSISEEGGMNGTILQTEVGENIVLPNLEISKVKATKKHKDMDKSEITDIVPQGSIVFSDKKTFSPKKYSDTKLSDAISFYSENENFNYKDLKIGDILGDDKKMTFAEAIEKVKKYYPTRDEKNLVVEETNKMNLSQREPIIKFLFDLQNKSDSNKTDASNVPKAAGGYPNNDIFPYNLLVDHNQVSPLPLDSINPSMYGTYVEPNFPYGTQIDPTQVGNLSTDNTQFTINPTFVGQEQNINRSFDPVSPLATLAPGQISQNRQMPTADQLKTNNSNPTLEELLNKLRSRYSQQTNELNSRHNKNVGDINSLIKRKNLNNSLQLGAQTLFSGLQSGYSNPALEDTSLIPDQFRGVPQSLIEQQAANLASNGNSTIKALSDAGVNPGDIANYAARVTQNISNSQSDLRSRSNQLNDQNNKAMIGEFRRVIQGNNQRLEDQQNHLTDFNNKRISSVGTFLNQYLGNKNNIDNANYKLGLEEESKYNSALNALRKAEDQTYIAEYQNKILGTNNQNKQQEVQQYFNSLSDDEKLKLLQSLQQRGNNDVLAPLPLRPLPTSLQSI